MPTETLVDPKSFLVWLVRGGNWTYQVASDLEDMGSSMEEQACEAATKAIEIVRGVAPINKNFTLDEAGQTPALGVILEVFLLHSKTEISFIIYTFLALANGGFYKDSHFAFNALVETYYEEAKTNKTLNEELTEALRKYKKDHPEKAPQNKPDKPDKKTKKKGTNKKKKL